MPPPPTISGGYNPDTALYEWEIAFVTALPIASIAYLIKQRVGGLSVPEKIREIIFYDVLHCILHAVAHLKVVPVSLRSLYQPLIYLVIVHMLILVSRLVYPQIAQHASQRILVIEVVLYLIMNYTQNSLIPILGGFAILLYSLWTSRSFVYKYVQWNYVYLAVALEVVAVAGAIWEQVYFQGHIAHYDAFKYENSSFADWIHFFVQILNECAKFVAFSSILPSLARCAVGKGD